MSVSGCRMFGLEKPTLTPRQILNLFQMNYLIVWHALKRSFVNFAKNIVKRYLALPLGHIYTCSKFS